MPTINESIIINATADKLFSLTHDYKIRQQWDPFTQRYQFLEDRSEPATGVKLIIYARNGLEMTVQYISFNPPTVAAIKMIKGPWFFNSFAGSWQYKQHNDQQCLLVFRYNFSAKPKWLRYIINPIVTQSLVRNTRQRLVALKNYAENKQ